MSWWTYINGIIKVSPLGRTQAEKTYILQTVLDHLPLVTGSEGDMEVYVNEGKYGRSSSCSRDEFGMATNNLRDRYGYRNQREGWLDCNESYIITISSSFRDRMFEETLKEFEIWLQRLAKRVTVEDILVKVTGDWGRKYVFDDYKPYNAMFEYPSWSDENGEPNWCEYLMWSRYKDWSLPLDYIVKYYDCPEADEEFERRRKR